MKDPEKNGSSTDRSEKLCKGTNEKMRYYLLDTIRGISIISMIIYHIMWDIVYIGHRDILWYRSEWGYAWQQSICWTFILLSGFCWLLGNNKIKRGVTVSALGALISGVTILFAPENLVVFGILTMLGIVMLIMIPLEKIFQRINPIFGTIISLTAFFLTRNINAGYLGFESLEFIKLDDRLYKGYPMTLLGFTDKDFYSTDYFSVIPWIFLFFAGYFIYRCTEGKAVKSVLRKGRIPGITFIGKNSLFFYLVHQPVIYLFFLLLLNK